MEADFISFQDGIVTLRNTAGKRITLPIARLSKADQAFIQQRLSSTLDDQRSTSRVDAKSSTSGKPATAKPVAKRFFNALIDQNFDELKSLLTPAAQGNWEAAKPLIEGLDVPDNRQAVLVRTAKAEKDMADVNVSVKVRGKFLRQHLQLRWSDGQWLVAVLIPDGDDASPINFEGSSNDVSTSGREDEVTQQEDDDEAGAAEDEASTEASEDDK